MRRELISLAIGVGLLAHARPDDAAEPAPASAKAHAASKQNDPAQLKKTAEPNPALAALLERAHLWHLRERDYMAREVLAKLFRVAPDHPDGLILLTRIQIRADQLTEAGNTLKRLRSLHPDHPGVAGVDALFRLKGVDKDKLRQARELAKAGNAQAALAAFRALRVDVVPDDSLVLEYWDLVAATPNGWEQTRTGLSKLSRDNPDNLRYRLALAEHLAQHTIPINHAALKTIAELTREPSISKQARAAWRRAILRLDPVVESIQPLRDYLAQEPSDSLVSEKLDNIIQTVEAQRKLLADPAYRAKLDGLALLDGGKLEAAEERLQKSLEGRPSDAETVGALGVLRMRQGHHAEAQVFFQSALQLDPAQRDKWQGLVRTARYWGLLRQAGDDREAKEFDLAEKKLLEARALDPREPNALLGLARVYAQRERIADAEKSYRDALAIAPANTDALAGLIGLYLRAGRDTEAEAMLTKLTPPQRKEVDASLNSLRAGLLREKADLLQSQARIGEAIAVLENAAAIDLDDPWLRYDLARLYAAQYAGKEITSAAAAEAVAKGQALFDALLQRRPADPAALYAMALFQSGIERESEALTNLERVAVTDRNPGMTQLQRRLWVRVQSLRAAMLVANGRTAAARELVATAQDAIGNDRELAPDIAGAYVDIGEFSPAQRLLERFATGPEQPTAEWRLRQASLLDRMSADAELRTVLDQITSPLTQQQKDTHEELMLSLSLRHAETLRQAGRLADALQVLQAAAARQPAPAQIGRLLYAEARILRALQRWNEAAQNYTRLLQLNPGDQDAVVALIETQVEAGKPDQARQLIQQQLESPRALLDRLQDGLQQARAADFSASLAGSLIAIEDYAGARRLVESALETTPDHPRLLAYAGQLAKRDGRTEQAIDYLQRSLAAEMIGRLPENIPNLSTVRQTVAAGASGAPVLVTEMAPAEVSAAERGSSGTYRQLAELLEQRTSWFSSALDWHSRAGSEGTSQYDAKEITFEWKQGWNRNSRWFYRADAVHIDGGALDLTDTGKASTFGSLLLCQPLCNTGVASQNAQGLALSAGFENEKSRLDIGTTPLGFKVTNLVGGILHKGDLGPFSYSVEASRRPVTGSLLSYAGARDPNTGLVWGGVVASGVRFGLSKDEGGSFGAWSSLSLHKITGKNVLPNNRVQLMAGGYWRAINQEDRLLTVGATGMLWHHSENAGEYTFGHGGYYSPQSFKSLSLPLTFGRRSSRFSFTLRGAVAVSWSQAKDALYYPTDAGMQARATTLAALNGIDPNYIGGNGGRSYSRSVAATWEYQMSPTLFIGGLLQMDRSADYTPNRFLLYLRFALDRNAARPVSFPPEPFVPSSQY